MSSNNNSNSSVGVPPWVWGPAFWNYMRIACETWKPASTDDTSLVDAMNLIPALIPCKNPCAPHFKEVLEKYPPVDFLGPASTREQRVNWYRLVRTEVHKKEPKKTAADWWRKNGKKVMWTIGFILLVVLAGCVGALCFKRCAEKSGKLITE